MRIPPSVLSILSQRKWLLLWLPLLVLLFIFYVSGLSRNPPGFYMDESCLAYNAYLISRTGQGESGVSFPLYVQCYTDGFATYANSPLVYLLALQFLIANPSIFAARLLVATIMFIACVLLGVLATRTSGSKVTGVILALTAMATPWLFDVSRLVFEVGLYPLALVIFLFCLYRTSRRESWTNSDSIMLALSLALLTYSYTNGRLLGPALAVGLIVFVVNRRRLIEVLRTWTYYGLTLIPLVIFLVRHPGILDMRFREVTFISSDKSFWSLVLEFAKNYRDDVSFQFLLFSGDPVIRHHVGQTGMIFWSTLILALFGVVLILIRHRRDRWWWFTVFGLIISVVPGALTIHRFHSLRLIAFPIFLLVLTIPAISWLLGEAASPQARPQKTLWLQRLANDRRVRVPVLGILMAATCVQAVRFQQHFHDFGPLRGHEFHETYPSVLKEALAGPARPIYLKDGFWGPTYVNALWYGVTAGLDPSTFVHLIGSQLPPTGSIVLSSEDKCVNCQILLRRGSFLLYKVASPEDVAGFEAWTLGHGKGDGPGEFSKPRGIATDAQGNLYVADSGNGRIQKFSPSGEFMAFLGKSGNGQGQLREPNAVVVDNEGYIYVADAAINNLTRLKPDGTFDKQWNGPAAGLSGPSDIAVGPDKQLYLIDRGRARVVKIDTRNDQAFEWGKPGTAAGEFKNIIGISVSSDRVFVTDGDNDRIQVFDLDGKFIRQWAVPQWDKYIWHRPDVVVDEKAKRVYVSSGWTSEVLVFDMDGNTLGSVKPAAPQSFNNVSALAMSETKDSRRLYALNTGSDVVDTGAPSVLVFELSRPRKKN